MHWQCSSAQLLPPNKFGANGLLGWVGRFFCQKALPVAIVRTCSLCRDAQKEPLFWTVSAWNAADGSRVAYKHKLCLTCVAAKIAPLQVHSDNEGMTCPACGIDTSDDFDAVYINWIPKGVGMLTAEAPFCNGCAARFRLWFEAGGERLEDREVTSRGQEAAPRYDASRVLASLGIDPSRVVR